MTAEIAILNRSAVVVAADSAITVGRDKVHTNANKIFSVSEKTPIGVMIYGYADFGGIPWETIIKLFRKSFKDKTFNKVREAADCFVEYLKRPQFIEASQSHALVHFGISILTPIVEHLRNSPRGKRSSALAAIIDRRTREIIDDDDVGTYSAPTSRAFSRESAEDVDVIIDIMFHDMDYSPSRKNRASIRELIRTALSSNYMSIFNTGVVFFGFGENELIPSLVPMRIDGAPLGVLRAKFEEAKEIDQSGPGVLIRPFADTDFIHTFMDGVSYKLKHFVFDAMIRGMEGIAHRVIADNISLSVDEMKIVQEINKKAISSIFEKFITEISDYCKDEYSHEILDIVKDMPKEDMATLAEALVEITALRKRVSSSVESVGGPVDVAVLTKGDGFIWIKRKHYFDLDKNIDFLYRRTGAASASSLLSGGLNGSDS